MIEKICERLINNFKMILDFLKEFLKIILDLFDKKLIVPLNEVAKISLKVCLPNTSLS